MNQFQNTQIHFKFIYLFFSGGITSNLISEGKKKLIQLKLK